HTIAYSTCFAPDKNDGFAIEEERAEGEKERMRDGGGGEREKEKPIQSRTLIN
ncbi:Hypothetical predicted protein, partial [Podarcis lilfordi]